MDLRGEPSATRNPELDVGISFRLGSLVANTLSHCERESFGGFVKVAFQPRGLGWVDEVGVVGEQRLSMWNLKICSWQCKLVRPEESRHVPQFGVWLWGFEWEHPKVCILFLRWRGWLSWLWNKPSPNPHYLCSFWLDTFRSFTF